VLTVTVDVTVTVLYTIWSPPVVVGAAVVADAVLELELELEEEEAGP